VRERVFLLLVALTFVASFAVAILCFAGAALAGCTTLAEMSTDDLTTLFAVVASLGASAMSFWAPRANGRVFARFRSAKSTGRVLSTLLLAQGLVWTGYLIERATSEHRVHAPSPATIAISVLIAAVFLLSDLMHSRSRATTKQ
jgi:hypothetical protein